MGRVVMAGLPLGLAFTAVSSIVIGAASLVFLIIEAHELFWFPRGRLLATWAILASAGCMAWGGVYLWPKTRPSVIYHLGDHLKNYQGKRISMWDGRERGTMVGDYWEGMEMLGGAWDGKTWAGGAPTFVFGHGPGMTPDVRVQENGVVKSPKGVNPVNALCDFSDAMNDLCSCQ